MTEQPLALERIETVVVRPTRPCMVIGGLSYSDWLARYRQELTDYFIFLHVRTHATPEEWSDYCRNQWIGERTFEMELEQ